MVDVTPLIKSNQMVIQSYGANGFKISGAVHDGNVIVFPDRVLPWDGTIGALLAFKGECDVMLMGTGKSFKMIPKKERPQGLHLEVMDTGAAARAYNALMADGRRVAAALTKV